MAIEIADFSIKNGDVPQLCKRLPEGKTSENYHMTGDKHPHFPAISGHVRLGF